MATSQISEHLLFQWAQHPDMQTDPSLQETFKERFQMISYKEQHQILSYMFSQYSKIESQYFLMELADMTIKQQSAYNNSQFKSKSTMVEFYIRNFSFDKEIEEIRTTIWALMQ